MFIGCTWTTNRASLSRNRSAQSYHLVGKRTRERVKQEQFSWGKRDVEDRVRSRLHLSLSPERQACPTQLAERVHLALGVRVDPGMKAS